MAEDYDELLKLIKEIYIVFEFDPPNAKEYQVEEAELMRDLHAQFAMKCFEKLPRGIQGIDSGQPWFLYWLTQIIEVLHVHDYQLDDDMKTRCVSYLRQCWNKEEGGFGGSPYLQSHIASTYAAMLAIVNIGTQEAYDIIDNNNYQSKENQWIQKDNEGNIIKNKGCSQVLTTLPGSVEIHENGEMDMRGVYCCLVIADILNLIEGNQELTIGMADFIASCQTYEGGISCIPYGEAHGGYTFCGLAAMIILNQTQMLDIGRLLEWLSNRQLIEEGGFNGRINKLVDSCYNFWQGASFELVDLAVQGKANANGQFLFNQEALQGYTILCCQENGGGLKDKPMKRPDMYHTCYALSGMSIAQHKPDYENLHSQTAQLSEIFNGLYENDNDKTVLLSGIHKNKLRRIHPVFNVRYDYLAKAKAYFRAKKQ